MNTHLGLFTVHYIWNWSGFKKIRNQNLIIFPNGEQMIKKKRKKKKRKDNPYNKLQPKIALYLKRKNKLQPLQSIVIILCSQTLKWPKDGDTLARTHHKLPKDLLLKGLRLNHHYPILLAKTSNFNYWLKKTRREISRYQILWMIIYTSKLIKNCQTIMATITLQLVSIQCFEQKFSATHPTDFCHQYKFKNLLCFLRMQMLSCFEHKIKLCHIPVPMFHFTAKDFNQEVATDRGINLLLFVDMFEKLPQK